MYWGFKAGLPRTAGPEIELLVPHSIGLEVDALYRRSGPEGARYDSVELPLIAKRYLPWSGWHWRPYAGGGYALRFDTGPGPSETAHGVVATAGIRVSLGRYRLWPEFRYTHWFGDLPTGMKADQAGFLTGVTF